MTTQPPHTGDLVADQLAEARRDGYEKGRQRLLADLAEHIGAYRWYDVTLARIDGSALTDDVVTVADLEEFISDVSSNAEHQAWLRSMTDPQTPEDYARNHEGAERLRAAMHEQALRQGDDYIHEATDGGGERG